LKTFTEIGPYNRYLNLTAPVHPLMDSRVCKQAIPSFPATSEEIQVNLYKIAFKKDFVGDIKYGAQQYDTSSGLLLFTEPGQVVSWNTLTFWDGYAFVFHPDLIKKHPIASKITQYKYFSYEINDALFMTPQEEETITWLFTKIHTELSVHKGQVNEELILSLLSVILTYADNYYQRQFQDANARALPVSARLKAILQCHYSNLSQPVPAIPNVAGIAGELRLSPNYLTDLVRAETGKSTIQLIHEYIIEQAEILLAQTSLNISEVASHLGFDNIAYFSKLFKKVRGVSPSAIREKSKTFRDL
jgi:AraC-like DNA-binding protein